MGDDVAEGSRIVDWGVFVCFCWAGWLLTFPKY